jgi:hypothetical protein
MERQAFVVKIEKLSTGESAIVRVMATDSGEALEEAKKIICSE